MSKKNEELNYFEDLEIDTNNIGEDLEKQHILNMQYHELLAEKNEEVNEQKRILKLKETDVKRKYAECFLKYKSTKIDGKNPTDKFVESSILVDQEYRKIQNDYYIGVKRLNTLIKQSEVLDGCVKSFQQRKNDLEKIVALIIFGYYGEVKQKESSKSIQWDIFNKLNEEKNNE